MGENTKKGIHIVVIIGSVQPGNYTSKAVRVVADELGKHKECTFEVIDPATMNLPFPGMPPSTDAAKLRESVSKATGVILSTPEYHGGYSSVIKLMIENMGFPSELAGKPISLLGVAAGRIGAIKSLESLRGICSHVGAIVMPGPISVAGIRQVFDEEGNCQDEATEKLIRSVATNLLDYIHDSICPKITLEAIVRAGAA